MLYSGNEMDRLRALARRHGVTRPADLCPKDDPTRRPAFNSANQLLQRAATFHLDLAVVAAPSVRRSTRRDYRSSFTFSVDDGQALGEFGIAGHIELAREALDLVTQPCSIQPAPAADPWVRDWYGASLAYQLSRGRFEVAHVLRAVELFRDDSDLLALGGAIHEALAAPQFQAALGSDRDLRDRLQVLTASGELGRSEDLLRRALQKNDALVEARIRLGNVLGLRGKHAEAARELERAVCRCRRGSAAGLLRPHAARSRAGRIGRSPSGPHGAYEQAQRLFPTAQAPRLALSQLLRGSGDAAHAPRDARSPGGAVERAGGRPLVGLSHGCWPVARAPCSRRVGHDAGRGAPMKPPAQAALACVLLTSATAGIAQQATFSVAVDVVRLDALVTDGGRVVRGLGLADFEVIDNKVPQQLDVVSFERAPLHVTLAFDMSVSVTGERLDHLRGAGHAVLDGLRAEDQAQLLTFSRPGRAAAAVHLRRGAAARGARRGAVRSAAPRSSTASFAATTLGGVD